MHIACPLAALAPGDAVRLDTSPPIAVFHTEDGELFALDDTCTHQDVSPAKLPVRVHKVSVVDGQIMVEESHEAPNLPPGLTITGHA